MSAPEKWEWWAGPDGEHFDVGPHASRAEALKEARHVWEDRSVHLVEAQKGTVYLADYIEADSIVERANESAFELMGEDGDALFDIGEAAFRDLEDRLRAAAREWQAAHKLRFVPYVFTRMRNAEVVEPTS